MTDERHAAHGDRYLELYERMVGIPAEPERVAAPPDERVSARA